MTAKQFYDWQTSGGTDDVMRLVDVLERADIAWCAIDGVAVNYWAEQPMVTQDVDLVVASDAVDRTVALLEQAGFRAERLRYWLEAGIREPDVSFSLGAQSQNGERHFVLTARDRYLDPCP